MMKRVDDGLDYWVGTTTGLGQDNRRQNGYLLARVVPKPEPTNGVDWVLHVRKGDTWEQEPVPALANAHLKACEHVAAFVKKRDSANGAIDHFVTSLATGGTEFSLGSDKITHKQ